MLSTIRLSSARSLRTFSTISAVRSEGAPSGHSQDSFGKRERAEEERYMREAEAEKLKALKKSIEASKKNLEQLEKDHAELEKSVKK
ncbi:hypothetical protein RQP46_010836 [Phenoliferia psychrophenolica]